jgi:hypothetical protein
MFHMPTFSVWFCLVGRVFDIYEELQAVLNKWLWNILKFENELSVSKPIDLETKKKSFACVNLQNKRPGALATHIV